MKGWFVSGRGVVQGSFGSSTTLHAIDLDNDDLVKQQIYEKLPPLGVSESVLPGEEAKRRRRKGVDVVNKYNKPNARVRLFCFYGVADASTSMRKWVTTAPDWLEIRIVELPGHGYLSEGLPPCAYRCSELCTNHELNNQLSEWIKSMADQLEIFILDKRQSAVPYSLYSFAFRLGHIRSA